MNLIAFRVTMYKGIEDSRWVNVEHLTVLVGKNESGKTSLLRALYKLNPYTPDSNDNSPDSYSDDADSYDINREYPRAQWNERCEEQVGCRAKFRLMDEEKSHLAKLAGLEKIPDTVEVTRNYAGKLEIHWDENMLLDEFSPHDLDNALSFLPEVLDEFGAPFKEVAQRAVDEAHRLASEGNGPELLDLSPKYGQLLSDVVSPEEPEHHIEHEFINRFSSDMPRVVDELAQLLSIRSQLDDYIATHLPTFIYMDDYRAFSGTAQLNEIQNRRDNGQLTDEDRTFLMILGLSGLDLGELIQRGQEGKHGTAVRKQDLTAGANILTGILADRLKPRSYVVDLDVDGPWFTTYIKDDFDQSPIELEDRSKGFQWAFSFELMFTHESKGTFENCVILLDEPGLHLHPNAQKQLLENLESYAKENTLLYTSHLPFMIDLKHPERIRVLEESADDGIVVTSNLIDTSADSKLVLHTALGMSISQNILVAQKNLVVEGQHDHFVLTALSNLLQESEGCGLPDDVRITPVAGASKADDLVTFMIGQDLDVVVLFDSDKAGRNAQKQLRGKWITQDNPESNVILLGEVVDVCGEFALEDLFPDEFYTDVVKELYGEELVAKDIDDIELPDGDTVWKRTQNFMKKNKIKNVNKGDIARYLARKINGMQKSDELPKETRNYTITLFQHIRDALK